MKHLIFSLFTAYFLTISAIILLKPVAVKIGLVDSPTNRKLHTGLVPLIGGIAMLFGLSIALLTLNISLLHYRALLASAAILVFVGVLDDFHELTPHARLYAQIFVGFLIILVGNTAVNSLGNLFFMGSLSLGIIGVPFTIIAVIGVINAINMMDGMDGLAGSIVAIMLCYLLVLAYRAGHYNDFAVLLLILGVVVGFLFFNFPGIKASRKIFMGDAGTMLLGVLLVWFLIDLSQAPQQAALPVSFLWIVALPLFDMVNVVYRRARRGKSWISADREHIHFLLKRKKFSDIAALLMLIVLAALFGLVGLLMAVYHWPEPIMFILFLAAFLFYAVFCNWFWPIKE